MVSDLLGVEPEVVGVAEHVLEDEARFLEPAARVSASTSQKVQRLKVPSSPVRPSADFFTS